jgi:orotate phosphoribosyltransferase
MPGADAFQREIIPQIDFLRGDFTLASGRKSDFYINGKTTTLRPKALHLAASRLVELLAGAGIDRVGGMTLGADALVGAIVALSHQAGTPWEGFIVRKESKAHGTGQAIEGPPLAAGSRVAIIEDVVTTAGSALRAIEAVRAAEPEVRIIGVWALVDREEGGREALAAEGLPLHSLLTKTDLFASLA